MSVWTLSKIAHKPSDSARAKSSGTRLTITVTEPGGAGISTGRPFPNPAGILCSIWRRWGISCGAVPCTRTHARFYVEINRNGNGAVAVLTSRASITTAHMIHALEFLAQDREDANAKAVHAAVDEPVRPINHQTTLAWQSYGDAAKQIIAWPRSASPTHSGLTGLNGLRKVVR